MDKPQLFSEVNAISRDIVTLYLNKYAQKFKWNKSGGSAIDLGCGDGSVTSILRKQVPNHYEKFYACDINEKMLEFAKKHSGHENIDFVLQNVQGELSTELISAFDNVFSFFLFHWISDPEKGFQNVFNLLKRGGECFHIWFGYLDVYAAYEILARTQKWSNWLKNIETFVSVFHRKPNPEEMVRKLMENIGFSNISVETSKSSYTSRNSMEFKKLIRAVDPHNMPDDVFDDFYKDYFKAGQEVGFIDRDNTEDGNQEITYNFTLIIVHANKPLAESI